MNDTLTADLFTDSGPLARSNARIAARLGERGRVAAQIKAENAEPGFTRRAADVMLATLTLDGPQSGEALTAACARAGIVPPDTRAMGAPIKMLVKRGLIQQVGWCDRARGHGTSGGRVWALA